MLNPNIKGYSFSSPTKHHSESVVDNKKQTDGVAWVDFHVHKIENAPFGRYRLGYDIVGEGADYRLVLNELVIENVESDGFLYMTLSGEEANEIKIQFRKKKLAKDLAVVRESRIEFWKVS